MKHFHFIGVGGIGMSALAYILSLKGNVITGSDLFPNNLTARLEEMGVKIYKGHKSDNVLPDTDIVVKSSCITDKNPEIIRAKELNIPIWFRLELLKHIIDGYKESIGITGTHGKTTTSALISHILDLYGKKPTILIGGEYENFQGNAKMGLDSLIVAEVDESDGLFNGIKVTRAVITNMEREHIENYGTMKKLERSYRDFIVNVPSTGTVVFNGDDKPLSKMASYANGKKVSFGLGDKCRYSCLNLDTRKSITFDLTQDGVKKCLIQSSLIGRHNAMNIIAASAICTELGIPFSGISSAIKTFSNVKRRFDIKGNINTVEIIEDYAHHPTEIKSVIKAARDYTKGRVISVFQPHRYSRTVDLADEFCESFYDSDILIITDTYSAFEKPVKVEEIKNVFKKIKKDSFEMAEFLNKEKIPAFLSSIVKRNDTVLILGAGDIINITDDIITEIKKRVM